MVVYYEDRQTGSIYSMPELAAAARREQMPLHELAKGVKPLPYSTVLLLEEAETIATNAAERRDRSWFDNLFS